jgi:small subunit ribosomal protein S16
MLCLARLGTLVRPFYRRAGLNSGPLAGNSPKNRGPADRASSAGCKDRNRTLDFERNRIAVVMIRLARVGARKQPYYRIVAIEKDRARNGRSIEVVGTYNPRTEPASVELKYERITYWVSQGAKLSPTVEKLVKKNPAPVPVADPAAV